MDVWFCIHLELLVCVLFHDSRHPYITLHFKEMIFPLVHYLLPRAGCPRSRTCRTLSWRPRYIVAGKCNLRCYTSFLRAFVARRAHREQGLRSDRGLLGVVVTPRVGMGALEKICRARAGVQRKKFLSVTHGKIKFLSVTPRTYVLAEIWTQISCLALMRSAIMYIIISCLVRLCISHICLIN